MHYNRPSHAEPKNDEHVYKLKSGSGFPKAFTRAEIDVLGEVIDRFRWDDSVFALAMTDSQRILMEEREILSCLVDEPTEIRAKLMKAEISRRAELSFVDAGCDGFLGRRRLYDALVERLRAAPATNRKRRALSPNSWTLTLRALCAGGIATRCGSPSRSRSPCPLPSLLPPMLPC